MVKKTKKTTTRKTNAARKTTKTATRKTTTARKTTKTTAKKTAAKKSSLPKNLYVVSKSGKVYGTFDKK